MERAKIEKTNKAGFEIITCSRCGGSGKFSYCQRFGDTCFKCGGSGVVLSARGHAAREYYGALLATAAGSFKVGGYFKPNSRSKWEKIEQIKDSSIGVNGVQKKQVAVYYSVGALHTYPETKYPYTTGNDDVKSALDKAREYQATLTKKGTPYKN